MTNSQITIRVNDEPVTASSGQTIQALLDQLGIQNHAIAVELNLQIQSSDKFSSTKLNDGDQLEIVTLVGGG